jgi:hypothetical protein
VGSELEAMAVVREGLGGDGKGKKDGDRSWKCTTIG